MISNYWLAGFTEADGHFAVKIVEARAKSDKGKISLSRNISVKFILDKRSYDKPNKTSMSPIYKK